MTGSLGVFWFALWMTLVSSSPDKNRRITEAERLMISKCLDGLNTQVIVTQLLSMGENYQRITAVILHASAVECFARFDQ